MRENIETIPNKVTANDLFDKIKKVQYIRIPDTTTTICYLTMQNGFTILGQSGCVDPKEYNAALGEKYAYENAVEKIWQLEGYLLAERRYQAGL
jgi:hypothetical protein